MSNSLSKFAYNVQTTLAKHSPDIFMALGIGAGISTVLLAVKATPKAMQLINDAQDAKLDANEELSDVECKLTPIETVKVAWKPYIPAVITGTISIGCLLGSRSITSRRTAALMTAYKISETALKDYKDAAIETVGEAKEKLIREKVADKKVEETPMVEDEVISTGKGNTRCFDAWSGRYFDCDIEVIRRAENVLNRNMMMDFSGYASLNDFYDEIGLKRTEAGDVLGWNIADGLMRISLYSKLIDEKVPCVVIDFYDVPRYGYEHSF